MKVSIKIFWTCFTLICGMLGFFGALPIAVAENATKQIRVELPADVPLTSISIKTAFLRDEFQISQELAEKSVRENVFEFVKVEILSIPKKQVSVEISNDAYSRLKDNFDRLDGSRLLTDRLPMRSGDDEAHRALFNLLETLLLPGIRTWPQPGTNHAFKAKAGAEHSCASLNPLPGSKPSENIGKNVLMTFFPTYRGDGFIYFQVKEQDRLTFGAYKAYGGPRGANSQTTQGIYKLGRGEPHKSEKILSAAVPWNTEVTNMLNFKNNVDIDIIKLDILDVDQNSCMNVTDNACELTNDTIVYHLPEEKFWRLGSGVRGLFMKVARNSHSDKCKTKNNARSKECNSFELVLQQLNQFQKKLNQEINSEARKNRSIIRLRINPFGEWAWQLHPQFPTSPDSRDHHFFIHTSAANENETEDAQEKKKKLNKINQVIGWSRGCIRLRPMDRDIMCEEKVLQENATVSVEHYENLSDEINECLLNIANHNLRWKEKSVDDKNSDVDMIVEPIFNDNPLIRYHKNGNKRWTEIHSDNTSQLYGYFRKCRNILNKTLPVNESDLVSKQDDVSHADDHTSAFTNPDKSRSEIYTPPYLKTLSEGKDISRNGPWVERGHYLAKEELGNLTFTVHQRDINQWKSPAQAFSAIYLNHFYSGVTPELIEQGARIFAHLAERVSDGGYEQTNREVMFTILQSRRDDVSRWMMLDKNPHIVPKVHDNSISLHRLPEGIHKLAN